MEQNDKLRLEHKQVLEKINKDVSIALENNEKFFETIHDRTTEVAEHRKLLVVQLAECIKDCEHKKKSRQYH